jgi:hypothetical protein
MQAFIVIGKTGIRIICQRTSILLRVREYHNWFLLKTFNLFANYLELGRI